MFFDMQFQQRQFILLWGEFVVEMNSYCVLYNVQCKCMQRILSHVDGFKCTLELYCTVKNG